MKTTVKKWAFNLVLLSLMASCGGDNNAAGGNGSVTNNENLNNGVNSVRGTSTYSGFVNEVENGHFEGKSNGRDFSFLEISSSSSNSSDDCDDFLGIPYCIYSFDSNFYSGSNGSIGYRRIDGNGIVTHKAGLDELDDFGNSLAEIRNNLLVKMKNADKVYKCLSNVLYNYYGELCYTENVWIQEYLKDRNNQWMNRFTTDPSRKESTRYIFEYNGATYLVDLKQPLGAQPVGIIKDGVQFEYNESFY